MGAAKDMLTSALFLAVSINLFFVVVWEVVFYFLYITKKEDSISNSMATRMVDLFSTELWQVVGPLPSAVRNPLLDKALGGINQLSGSVQQSDTQEAQRKKHNRRLLYYSLAMCGAFLLLVVVFGIMCGVRKVFPDQKHMWLELFVVMVGFVCFDFFFFDYVVKNFMPLSAGKFQRIMMEPALQGAPCFPVAAAPAAAGGSSCGAFAEESAALKQVASDMESATTMRMLADASAELEAALERAGAAVAARSPPPRDPATPSMPLDDDVRTDLAKVAANMREVASDLCTAGVLMSHFGVDPKSSGWVESANKYLARVLVILQHPTSDGIRDLIRNLPTPPRLPS